MVSLRLPSGTVEFPVAANAQSARRGGCGKDAKSERGLATGGSHPAGGLRPWKLYHPR